MIGSIINSVMRTFKQNNDSAKNITTLNPQISGEFSAYLKDFLSQIGSKVFVSFLLQFDENENLLVRNGKTFYFKKPSTKRYLTPFGEILLPRRMFQAADGETYFPLDEKWGMSKQFATIDVQEIVALAIANSTQKESAFLLQKACLFNISEKGIRSIVENIGRLLERNEVEILDSIHCEEEEEKGNADVVAFSLDGATIQVRDPGKEEEEKAFLAPNEQKKRYCRKVAMVSSITKYKVVDEEERKVKEKLSTSYQAKMPSECWEEMKDIFEREVKSALKQEPDAVPVIVMDGQRSLWSYVDSRPIFKKCRRVVDFYHACEHLYSACLILFKDPVEARIQYLLLRSMLKKDKEGAKKVLEFFRKWKKKLKLKGKKAKALEAEETYFENNLKRMKYQRFLKKGWPIGSGPVEAACKTVVKTRMCRSGMKWEHKGGQNILTLRAIVKSERWQVFWNSCSTLLAVA